MILPSLDFETYSEAGYIIDPVTKKVTGAGPRGKGGLPVVGVPVYAEHPSTEILSLKYNLKDGYGIRSWYPGTPPPHPLFDYVMSGGLIEAWNIPFEFWIWNIIGVRRHGWPPLPFQQCVCAMAKSKRYSLPGKLDLATKVLGVEGKDPDGDRLIRKLCVPHTPTKNRKSVRWAPATAWNDFKALYAYNGQDTVAEDNASALMPDLTEYERRTWLLDRKVNLRGVQVDVPALDACLSILEQAEEGYNAELAQLTNGQVQTVNEVKKFTEWLNLTGCHTATLDKNAVSSLLERNDLQPQHRRTLEIRAILGSANVKKLRTLKLQLSSDGRLREQYSYCGADRTGRWSAGGVQLQNITSKGPKTCRCEGCEKIFGFEFNGVPRQSCPRCGSFMFHVLKDWDIKAVEEALADIATRDLRYVEAIWGDPITLLGGCLRGLFIAKEGHKFICCDFSAIEAVVAACLSRCQWRVDVFNGDGKIYEASVSKVTGIPLQEILDYKKQNGKHHPLRGTLGKIRELAGPYGGWVGAWKNFGAEAYFEDEEAIKQDVLKFRAESPEIVEMWGGQFRWVGPGKWDYQPELFGLEGMAIKAILTPGTWHSYLDISYIVHNDVLHCRLPSGRFLYYHRPRLVNAEDKLKRGPCYKITFEGYNSNPNKGPIGWHRMETYGGRLFENVDQATSCDIQAEALQRCEDRGYHIVMHTHDEGTAEVPLDFGSVEEMAAIMSERPSWASWWPIRAAGWTHKRYQKD